MKAFLLLAFGVSLNVVSIYLSWRKYSILNSFFSGVPAASFCGEPRFVRAASPAWVNTGGGTDCILMVARGIEVASASIFE